MFCSHLPVPNPTMFMNVGEPEHAQRRGKDVGPVVHQVGIPSPHHEGRDDRRGHEQVGIVEQVVDPVAPTAQEAVRVTEGALGPGVDPTLVGKARCQLGDRESLRDEEEERRQYPERKGAGAGCRRRRQPAQTENRDDVEQHEVAEAQSPWKSLGVRDGGGLRADSD